MDGNQLSEFNSSRVIVDVAMTSWLSLRYNRLKSFTAKSFLLSPTLNLDLTGNYLTESVALICWLDHANWNLSSVILFK